MKSFSIKTQILFLTLALVSVSLGFLIFLTVIQISDQLHSDMVKRAVSMISVISTNVEPGIEHEEQTYIQNIVSGAFEDKDILAICICDENDNQIYFQSNSDSISEDEFDIYCPAIDTVIINHLNGMVIVSKAIKLRGKFIGDIWMAMSEKEVGARIKSSILYLLSFAALVLLITFIAGKLISSKIVYPVKIFENAAKRVQNGDMIWSIDTSPLNKDFIPLAEAFNKMSSGLEIAFDELRASHQNLEAQVEIRTSELQKELGERKKAQEALKESQQKLELHVQQTPLGVIQWDLNFRVVEWNSAAEKIFGYSAEEAIGCHPCGFITTKQIEDAMDKIWSELVRRKGGTRSTNENITKSGETILCEWYNTPLIDDNGQTIGVASLVLDITEQKKAEEQKDNLKEELERAQRMESLGILAGGVAHDLNNMLGPLVGYPELIIMKLPEASPIRKQIERIGRSAKDAADVIQDLLTLARRGRYEMVPTNLIDVIESYIDSPSYQKLSEERPEIIMNCDFENRQLFINGSPPHLSKVVMNLIVNATDAMPASGTLDISVSTKSIDRLIGGYNNIEPGEYVILRVRDTGSGIDPEDIDKIFEPYYSKKKMGTSGSGLGLSVVYGIVKDHHGYYDIFSSKGKGTEFVLYFPAIEKPSAASNETKDEVGGQEKILIVDDAPEQRDIATEFLTNLGYNVITTENGHKALEYLSKNKVDLVLLDMIMEKDFDGLDTYREILKIRPGQKAIVISGFSATERVDEILSLGAGVYVKKPFTFGVLSKAIRDELDRQPNTSMPVV